MASLLPSDILICVLDILTTRIHCQPNEDPFDTIVESQKASQNKRTRLNFLIACGAGYSDLLAHSRSVAHRCLSLGPPPFASSSASNGGSTSVLDTLHAEIAAERLMVIGYTQPFDSHNPVDHAFEAYRTELSCTRGGQPLPWSARSWARDHAWNSFFKRLGHCSADSNKTRDALLQRAIKSERNKTLRSEDWTPILVWAAYCGYVGTICRILGLTKLSDGSYAIDPSRRLLDVPRTLLAPFRGRTALFSALWMSSPCLEPLIVYLKAKDLLDPILRTPSNVAYRLHGHWRFRRWHLARLTPAAAAQLLDLKIPSLFGNGKAANRRLRWSCWDEDVELSSFLAERPASTPILSAAILHESYPALAIGLSHPRSDLYGPLVPHKGDLPALTAIKTRRAHALAALLADPRMERVKGHMDIDLNGLGDAEIVAKLVTGWLGS